jgi:FkbM family methyltransferase
MNPIAKLSHRLRKSISFRRKWAGVGVYFLRSSDFRLRSVRINGKVIRLRFPTGERDLLTAEFMQIFYHDCYGLGALAKRPASILDVGGNVGIFSVVARHYFPAAVIHCYEPNPSLAEILTSHLSPLGVRLFPEAVGRRSGRIKFEAGEDSLHSVVETGAGGNIVQASLSAAIDRIGGAVDLLKLDCEGSEWEILQDVAAMSRVNHLTMEYHLWAKPGSTLRDMEALLTCSGFRITFQESDPGTTWGLLRAARG